MYTPSRETITRTRYYNGLFLRIFYPTAKKTRRRYVMDTSQPARDVKTTLIRRRFKVLTSLQRPYNVVSTSCARWGTVSFFLILQVFGSSGCSAVGWLYLFIFTSFLLPQKQFYITETWTKSCKTLKTSFRLTQSNMNT